MGRTDYTIDKEKLVKTLTTEYKLSIESITFIPVGESSFCYKIDCKNRPSLLAKIYINPVSIFTILNTIDYLRYKAKIVNIPTIIKTSDKALSSTFETHPLVVYEFIQGKNYQEDSEIPDEVIARMGEILAHIHNSIAAFSLAEAKKETFDISFLESLNKLLTNLEDPIIQSKNEFIAMISQEIKENKKNFDDKIKYLTQATYQLEKKDIHFALIHEDPSTNNWVLSHDNTLYLLDWDSVMIGLPERDLLCFNDNRFDILYSSYIKFADFKSLSLDAFRYHIAKFSLEVLNEWLEKILYKDSHPSEFEHSYNCIKEFCFYTISDFEIAINRISKVINKI